MPPERGPFSYSPGRAKREPVTKIKIASWNINSVRARIPIVERLINEQQPDILCLQETKVLDSIFPAELFHRHGYRHWALNGQRIVMDEGTCWYVNVNFPHRVANRGTADRVHLVIDCIVDDWLRSIMLAAAGKPDTDS